MRAILRLFLYTLPLLLAAAAPAAALTTQAGPQPQEVTGIVVDASGGAVPGALVVLAVGGQQVNTVTDRTGRFHFAGVPPGPAKLSVVLDRFQPVEMTIDARRLDLEVVLHPRSLTEQLTVLGGAIEAGLIAALKTPTPLRDVPQSVTVIGRDLIADQAMRGLADVARYVPGLGMAQGEGHRDAPIFRGNVSTSDLFVDGVRDDTQYVRDLYNVERIEILKGANGMMFGRGGVGGVINRVTRQADGGSARELSLHTGQWNQRRVTADLAQPLSRRVSARVTGVYENSDSYRDSFGLERYGIHPTAQFIVGPETAVRVGYEFFHDTRTTDRGVPSLGGRPLDTDPSTFFGKADDSAANVTVHTVSSIVEHSFGGRATLRSRTSYAEYDKFYQNVFPGAVNADAAAVSLSAYNNDTLRQNLFNQTDLLLTRTTGRIGHTLLVGLEVGRQATDNLRQTGYFTSVSPTTTSVSVPLSNPTTALPVEFRPSATDADNSGVATTAAVYAQDQIALSDRLLASVGLRYERFAIDFRNNRTGEELSNTDGLVSPRVGVVYKLAPAMSLYASHSRTSLPRAGEQLSSLSLTNQALEPETFRNHEIGAKWDIVPGLSATAAAFRLDRGNVAITDPLDPTQTLLVDAQRTTGLELGLSGRLSRNWTIAGGYAWQDGEITRSISASAQAGARLGQVPAHTFSLWNRYDFSRVWGAGVGLVSRSDMFAATDNAVVLPGFARVDAAVFFSPLSPVRVQVNLENVLDARYYATAHSNNNITPGSPRAVRVSLSTRF